MERGLIKISIGYIHYRATGQGKPIILLHATGRSSDMYLKFMPVLGRKLRVFALDTPSFGCSDHIPGPPGTYAVGDYARWVIEVMDGLGVEKASFMGLATGAYISVELANAYPARVEKLAICPPFWDKEVGTKILSGHLANDYPTDASGFPLTQTLDFMREKMPDAGHPTQAWVDMHNLGLIQAGRDLWQAAGALVKYDLRSNAERLQCPALLIWGDNYLRHRQGARYVQVRDEFASHFKNRQVVIMKDATAGFFWESPEEVGEVVLKFLA